MMTTPYIIFMVTAGVTLLLWMALKLKINAFIALIVTSIFVGIMTGMPVSKIPESIQKGIYRDE